MAEFHGFLPSFSKVSIANKGVNEMSVRARWGGRWQNSLFGTPLSSHDVYTVSNDTLVGHRVSGSKSRSPLPNWHTPLVPLSQSWLWRVGKMPLRKAKNQLTLILTLDTLGMDRYWVVVCDIENMNIYHDISICNMIWFKIVHQLSLCYFIQVIYKMTRFAT